MNGLKNVIQKKSNTYNMIKYYPALKRNEKKKEWNIDECYNMDEPQKHYAK